MRSSVIVVANPLTKYPLIDLRRMGSENLGIPSESYLSAATQNALAWGARTGVFRTRTPKPFICSGGLHRKCVATYAERSHAVYYGRRGSPIRLFERLEYRF